MMSAKDRQTVLHRLLADARRLRDAVGLLGEAPADEIEERCRRHMAESERCRADMTRAVEQLKCLRRDGALDAESEAAIREAAEILRETARAYGPCLEDIRKQIAGTSIRLDELRQGGRALRGYARRPLGSTVQSCEPSRKA